MTSRRKARVPGSSPEPGWTLAQHEAAAAAYWAAVRRRTGVSPATRPGLTTSQHILHLLISVFTCGLWLPVWFWLAHRSVRPVTDGDPSAPMPVWPPPDPSAWGPGAQSTGRPTELLTEMHPDRQLAAIQDDPAMAAEAQRLYKQAVARMRHDGGPPEDPQVS